MAEVSNFCKSLHFHTFEVNGKHSKWHNVSIGKSESCIFLRCEAVGAINVVI